MEDKEIIEAEIIEDAVITDEEAKAVFELEKKYLESYVKNRDKMELKEWLVTEMKQDLPEREVIEVEEMAVEIIETIKRNDESIESLRKAKERGMSNEQWLNKKIKESTQNMELNKVGEYLQSVDEALLKSNENLFNEITTKSDMINMNPNLDGFIAEQELVNSFNNNAVLEGSKYRAEALTPDVYGKNSFDIVIKDGKKRVHQYQAKFGATAEDTIRYIKNGNYNNQQLIVPKDQVEEVQKAFPGKSVTSYVGGTERVKTKGKGFDKTDVKRMQEDAQIGKTENLKKDWNSYEISDLARGIGKSAAFAGVASAGITAGFDIATRVVQGREIKGEEIIETALRTGADTGVKAAVAGAVKVASEKGLISMIPKGTPARMIVNVVHVGIENIKVMGKIASGELTLKEGIDKMGETTVGIVGGIVASGVGADIGAGVGAAIGSVLGPVGTAVGAVVGGFIGGTVGYIAGSEIGKGIAKAATKVRDTAVKVAVGIVETGARVLSSVVNTVSSGIKSIGRALAFWNW